MQQEAARELSKANRLSMSAYIKFTQVSRRSDLLFCSKKDAFESALDGFSLVDPEEEDAAESSRTARLDPLDPDAFDQMIEDMGGGLMLIVFVNIYQRLIFLRFLYIFTSRI